MQDVVNTNNEHSGERNDDNNKIDESQGLNKPGREPKTFVVDGIARHIGNGAGAKCVVRRYS